MNKIEVGELAPDFTLPDKSGNMVSLKSLKGSWIVLYFYPKDNTSGCTTEAIDFTSLQGEFENEGAVILGTSRDSQKSHCSFAAKHSLTITLLSDEEMKVLKDYNAWGTKKMYGKESEGTIRSTVLIDPKGIIRYVWKKVSVNGHAEEVLAKLRELKG